VRNRAKKWLEKEDERTREARQTKEKELICACLIPIVICVLDSSEPIFLDVFFPNKPFFDNLSFETCNLRFPMQRNGTVLYWSNFWL
jgi:hypothetical protein